MYQRLDYNIDLTQNIQNLLLLYLGGRRAFQYSKTAGNKLIFEGNYDAIYNISRAQQNPALPEQQDVYRTKN